MVSCVVLLRVFSTYEEPFFHLVAGEFMVAEAEPAPRQRDHGDGGCDEERLVIPSDHER